MEALTLVVGDKNSSSWSMRPWLLLRHAEIPFEEKVVLFDTPRWREDIVKLSPSRKVPALRHGDLVVCESLAICEYIADLFPEKSLWPRDVKTRALARSVANEMHAGFAAMRREMSMDVVARHPPKSLSTEAESDVERVKEIWRDCRARFAEDGPFLFGAFSVADAMFAPVVWRFRTCGVACDVDWYETMLALPAMRAWEKDAEAEVEARSKRPRGLPSPDSAQHCYAVVFSSQLKNADGYAETAEAMVALAKKQPGFLGIEAARGVDGFGITVSYWDSPEAIKRWRDHAEHRIAQAKGREFFYARYDLRICVVERGYRFP